MRCCISSRRIISCNTLYTACSGYFYNKQNTWTKFTHHTQIRPKVKRRWQQCCEWSYLSCEVLHNGMLRHLGTNHKSTLQLFLNATQQLLVFFCWKALSTYAHNSSSSCFTTGTLNNCCRFSRITKTQRKTHCMLLYHFCTSTETQNHNQRIVTTTVLFRNWFLFNVKNNRIVC